MAKALDHHCGEYTQFLSAEPHRTQVHRRQRLFTPFPLREIPVPDTRIYDIQPGERGRDLAHPFGSEEYGKEELTAEFAAALAGMFFGIAEHIRTENAAYLKSWIKAIREEPKFILNVLADAMKIVKMIAGKLDISVESEETAADEAEQVA